MINLVKRAGIADQELEGCIKEINSNCEVCLKFKRPRPRPIVSLPMASVFNDTVSMDLKIWGNVYFLVLVDLATRFCAATVVRNKSPVSIISGIFRSWICVFGAPRKILSDNGGEFNNDQLRSLGEAFNIRIMCTAAESPWSNGVCERLNAVLGDSVRKIISDCDCDIDIALAWSVSARNALDNNHGFSPNQLVFGVNPVFQSIFINDPPPMETRISSKIV